MLFYTLAFAAAAVAAPLEKRLISPTDHDTLNTLLYMENLQFALFNIGCNSFSDNDYTSEGFPSGFRESICYAGQQGQAHAATITNGLTQNAASVIKPCTYNFPTVVDAQSFVSAAMMVNTVIESAYLGAAEYLADAAGTDEIAQSIAVVKARQGTFLRSYSGAAPFPATFDTGISKDYANHLVQQMISTCPTKLPVQTFPNLNINGLGGSQLATVPTNVGGTNITITYPSNILAPFVNLAGALFNLSSPLYMAFISQNTFAPTYVPVSPTGATSGTVTFPQGVQGVVYAVLTPYSGQGAQFLSMDDLTLAGTAAGPVAMIVT